MLPSVLHIAALLCLASMSGCELCVAAFLEPALRSLPEGAQLLVVPRAARQLGAIMPFWYIASLLLTLADAFTQHHARGTWAAGPLVAGGLQVLIVGLTLALLVPLNTRLARMTDPYTGWLADAQRWDRLHRLRVALLLLACAILAFWPA